MEVWTDGELITVPSTDINSIREEVGMVFQHFNLFPHMTMLKNVSLSPIIVRGMDEDKANACPASFSGGQKQRMAIARALAMHPKVVLFDESLQHCILKWREKYWLSSGPCKRRNGHDCRPYEKGFAREIADRVFLWAMA